MKKVIESIKIEDNKEKNSLMSNKELLRHELEKPYYDENFLDCFDLPETMNVSAIIPTYNRCPYDPRKPEGKLNPLFWCLESLINQKPKLEKIIVINDNSDDYTIKLLRIMRKKARENGIIFTFLSNKERKGSSICRNMGIKRAISDFVFFMDDDCIAKKYSVFGLFHTVKKLSEDEIKVGAIHLPVYVRLTCPSLITEVNKIGKLKLEKGRWSSNYDKFPRKYLTNSNGFLDENYKILKPVQIQNLSGCFLTPKKRLSAVGGFPKFFTWKNSYGEETELACRFMQNGYSLFFCPDPKFGVYHGKFGESSKIPVNKKDFNKHRNDNIVANVPLYKINEECAKPRLKTGNRVSSEEWYYSKIISHFVIFYPRNIKGALKWIENTKINFVEEQGIKSFATGKWAYITDKDKREEIWYNAILDGLELVTKMDKTGLWNFLKKLEKIRKFNASNQMEIFSDNILKKFLQQD